MGCSLYILSKRGLSSPLIQFGSKGSTFSSNKNSVYVHYLIKGLILCVHKNYQKWFLCDMQVVKGHFRYILNNS